jgi:hypothetical protein
MTNLQMATLLAIANIKDRSTIEPAEFFGIAEEVKAVKDNAVSGLQSVFGIKCGVHWDGKSPLWQTIISECIEQCAADRAAAHYYVDKLHFEEALRIVEYDKAIPRTLGLDVLEKARAILAKGCPVKPEGEV